MSITDGFAFSKNDEILVKANGKEGIYIYDAQDKQNIILKSVIVIDGDSDDVQFFGQDQHIMIGHGLTGVTVLNIENLEFPYIECEWQNDTIIGSVENIIISKTEKFVVVSIRHFGIVILQIDVLQKNMDVLYKLNNGHAEMAVISPNEQYVFFTDGNVGIRVLNINPIQNAEEVKIIPIEGFPGKLRLFQFEGGNEYLFVQLQDEGLICVVDITEPMSGQKIMEYSVESDTGYDVDCIKNFDYCYILIDTGIRILPLKNQIYIHTEFSVQQNNNNKQIQISGQELLVGQKTFITLIPFNAGVDITIDTLYLYSNFFLEPIPSYMQFDKSSLTLIVDVDKQGLPKGMMSNSNIVLILLSKQIQEQTFINEKLGIDLEKSIFIRKACLMEGYVNEFYYANPNFNIYQKMFQSYDHDGEIPIKFTNNINEFIKNKLIQNIIQFPISLKYVQSLNFYPQDSEQNIIETLSDNIQVKIEILDVQKAEFVLIPYSGALVDESIFLMEGQKDLVLKILTQELIIHSYVSDRKQIQIIFTINDEYNHEQIYDTDLQICQFLSLHEGIMMSGQNQNQELQKQFDESYPGGVYINEEFNFKIQDFTFQSKIDLPLQYVYFIKTQDDIEYVQPPNGFWIQVNNMEKKIQGIPTLNNLNQIVQVKVQVFDGYSLVEQEFTINITKIPIIWFIEVLIYIASPVITLIGLMRFFELVKVEYDQLNDMVFPKLPKLFINLGVLHETIIKIQIIGDLKGLQEEDLINQPTENLKSFSDHKFQEILEIYEKYLKPEYQKEVSLKLIIKCILHESYGFKMDRFKKYFYGISLKANLPEIQETKAMIKSEKWYVKLFPKISEFLNIDYQIIPMGNTNPLPKWLKYEENKYVMQFQGIWSSIDYEHFEYKIRIINIYKYPIKEYKIIRLHSKNIHTNIYNGQRHSFLNQSIANMTPSMSQRDGYNQNTPQLTNKEQFRIKKQTSESNYLSLNSPLVLQQHANSISTKQNSSGSVFNYQIKSKCLTKQNNKEQQLPDQESIQYLQQQFDQQDFSVNEEQYYYNDSSTRNINQLIKQLNKSQYEGKQQKQQ